MLSDYFIQRLSENLPYVPTEEQAGLVARLAEFLWDDNVPSVFVIKGYAGTGKTSLVGALVKTLETFERACVLLAPTGRAAKVFASYAAHPAYTIHKKIYRQRAFTGDFTGFQLAHNAHKNTFFIVDEASMIANEAAEGAHYGSGLLLDDLFDFVYSGAGCRLILLGDTAQLPPVGQVRSPALDEEYLRRYGYPVFSCELTHVVRQVEESGVLFNATRLRNAMQENPLPVPSIAWRRFPDVSLVGGDELIEVLSSAYRRDGMDETIIVTRSNKRANIFNQGIRNRILYREEELASGDLLLVARNNYFWSEKYEKLDFIANGDVARVVRVRRVCEMYGFRFADVVLYFPDYEEEMEAKVILDTLHSESPSLTAEENTRLFNAVMEDYADVPSKRERLKRLKNDPWFNALQVKYAYAVTCHKAQGGQWANVFIDMGYIRPDMLGLDFYRWLYTAFTRTTGRLWLINVSPDYIEEKPSD
ncbi:MAG TPA: AAA family ATPase [Candidatus Caccoplasma merdavium]|nr:AAA family ATPase [Candidatus Caccoplasma merdavium]